MARKIFISFLGTSDYELCRYVFADNHECTTRFVQEAIISHSCKGWTANDRIFIFLTENAKKTNWEKLTEALGKIDSLPPVEAVDIPGEISERTIWDVFRIIYNKLRSGDSLLIDITHGFRSSPMLLLTLINYSSFLRGTLVNRIYYGAFTSVRQKETDCAPVWDITDLVLLHEWTLAANEFLNFGNPGRICTLARKSAIPHIADETKKESAKKITGFAASVSKTADLFSTVRGDRLFSASDIRQVVYSSAEIEKLNFIAPMQPFMSKTIEKYAGFEENNVMNFLQSVKYCICHGMIQQGITFLQEGIISFALERTSLQWHTNSIEQRTFVLINRQMCSGVLNYLCSSKSNADKVWKWPPDYPADSIEKLVNDPFCLKIAGIYCTISEYRNDINHGGYICPREPQKFTAILEKGYKMTLDAIKLC